MARPTESPAEPLTLKLTADQLGALQALARELGCSVHAAAKRVFEVGLVLHPISRMAVGSSALVPAPCSTLAVFALGPKDAARAEQLITLWGEKEE